MLRRSVRTASYQRAWLSTARWCSVHNNAPVLGSSLPGWVWWACSPVVTGQRTPSTTAAQRIPYMRISALRNLSWAVRFLPLDQWAFAPRRWSGQRAWSERAPQTVQDLSNYQRQPDWLTPATSTSRAATSATIGGRPRAMQTHQATTASRMATRTAINVGSFQRQELRSVCWLRR
jgi:hypothetical protein